ncbi:CRM-domain containing factor CFM3, chloroplastic/mitochondrial isoform X1 [Jatropha curcas]|uniref:CRM-domain containing factor CFM3, chloroplastic/mitochondrial isoform X1 n=1 Tax=Jatropha curcas TaxID=180498 RepID=UPI0018952D57|nr:CRM-domain containing factor CFM3, chloroplastic/mitochondrial isoform X1 [Jatropha curcas]
MALFLPTSNSCVYPLSLQTQNHSPFKTFKFETYCRSGRSIEVSAANTTRKNKPSFFEQIRDKWSVKIPSRREKFPWEELKHQQQQEQDEEEEIDTRESSGVVLSEGETDASPSVSRDPVSYTVPSRSITAPSIHRTLPKRNHLSSQPKDGENLDGILDEVREEDNVLHVVVDNVESSGKKVDYNHKFERKKVKFNAVSVELTRDKVIARAKDSNDVLSSNKKGNLQVSQHDNSSSNGLPWEREREVESSEGDWRRNRINTELAERMLPEHELKRLRNNALRMFERIKVGAAGINQDLVDAIHENWRLSEVVKLKFEWPLSCNMKRTHEILESRTGGLVIWRSGSSVVLYRGMTYNFQCVQSYSKQNEAGNDIFSHPEKVTSNATHNVGVIDFNGTTESFMPGYARHLKDLSQEELTDFNELNQLLDELGPRFKDWCGREPLPVDADLLPAVDPGYKAPFRLLPYGVRHCLTNKEMTVFRRLARQTPPHFALGRSRELQGLAKAMVKLWERSAIAKIAIKRGVQNTRNERMAEELKFLSFPDNVSCNSCLQMLTGGTLLSRNKEYIVFYRGNDFLPPAIMETLRERRKLTYLKQDEEEKARNMASAFVDSNSKTIKGPLVAGTLAETVAATSHWRIQSGSKDVEEMLRNAALAKSASLVKHLENKLALAKGKLKRAEKALTKVQENLEPAEFPTDLETITDEERVLFRKLGLSMKPYLLLGRRGVYDGTIENMHLHWKYREVVKVIVKEKNFRKVKHIAISLEAESSGVLVSVDRTTKGYAIIIYRGKNYQRPQVIKPKNLLTKRQALARSIELQRREALKHHISDLQERVELLKSELEEMQSAKKIDVDKKVCSILDDASVSDTDVEEEGEEAFLELYDSSNEDTSDCN